MQKANGAEHILIAGRATVTAEAAEGFASSGIKLHIIEGGAHGFGKKHDAIAMAHLRRFAERERT